MNADARPEEGNYVAAQKVYRDTRDFKESAIAVARAENASKAAAAAEANAVHFGKRMPFRPAVEINWEARSRELAKVALAANRELVTERNNRYSAVQ